MPYIAAPAALEERLCVNWRTASVNWRAVGVNNSRHGQELENMISWKKIYRVECRRTTILAVLFCCFYSQKIVNLESIDDTATRNT
jgi:hypothetical protein